MQEDGIIVPDKCDGFAQVAIFEDGSISVVSPPLKFYGEEQIAAALKFGLETLGYRVDMERTDTSQSIEITDVHDPLTQSMAVVPEG